MMEAASTCEMSVNFYQTTWCNIPEDSHLHTYHHEILKSHQEITCLLWNLKVYYHFLKSLSLDHNGCVFLPCSGKGTGLGGLSNSQSVSFRQGTNVEFGTPTFATNGPQGRVVNITPMSCLVFANLS
jgi:hypothetical protein